MIKLIETLSVGLAVICVGLAYYCGVLLLVAALIGFPVKWLWNAVLPDLLGVNQITFWQAVGLAILCGLLLKSSSGDSKKEKDD